MQDASDPEIRLPNHQHHHQSYSVTMSRLVTLRILGPQIRVDLFALSGGILPSLPYGVPYRFSNPLPC